MDAPSLTNTTIKHMKKFSFSLKEQNSGNILTVHHTIKEDNKLLRIVLTVCCFDVRGTLMVAIDRRGCIFIFDFTSKRYWRHNENVKKASVAVASRSQHNQFVIGTKNGDLALLDVEISNLIRRKNVSQEIITDISFPGQPLDRKNVALISTTYSALLIDLDTFNCSYRLDFDKVIMTLKFASFLPNSDHILTAFTNDVLHIWSAISLEVVRIVHPLKLRDKKMQIQEGAEIELAEFALDSADEKISKQSDYFPKFRNKHFTDGLLLTYAYKSDNSALLLSTWDNFLLIFSIYTFEMTHIYRLKDFLLLQFYALTKPNDSFFVGLTNRRTVVLLDCENVEYKLNVELEPCRYLSISLDNKYLAVSQMSGELSVWSLGHILALIKSQKKCMSALKTTYKKKKVVKISYSEGEVQFQQELKKLLTHERLKQILQEYHCFPSKYRVVIWSSLLQLPHNRQQYQEFLQMGEPSPVSLQAKRIQMKNATLKRSLIKCWSCLTQWCKVLGHSEIFPGLIFPFVKMFQQSPLTAFEVCCTLIQNQFQLFFEYHPLEPTNYLGICTNLLQHFDSNLYEFYQSKDVTATIFAWSLAKTTLSEVLDEDQWMCLWDNVLAAPSHYLCFVVVAYNILLKEVIIRLPDKNVIEIFFKEQNPIDINKLISKAFKLLNRCPTILNPQRYFSQFQSIPPNVYPKFVKYPHKSLNQYEDKVEEIKNVHTALDARMRELELEELQVMQRLENGLRQEEHKRRMKEIEMFYQKTLQREQERINCQRKMLLLYTKEIRQRKGLVVAALQDSTNRKAILQKEHELHSLQNHIENERLRNDLNLMWAEEELQNHDLELLSHKLLEQPLTDPLKIKYYDNIKQLSLEQRLLNNDLKMITPPVRTKDGGPETESLNKLYNIEYKLKKIKKEFQQLTKQCDK